MSAINFPLNQVETIKIGGKNCTGVEISNERYFRCHAPRGIGLNKPIEITIGGSVAASFVVNYMAPSIVDYSKSHLNLTGGQKINITVENIGEKGVDQVEFMFIPFMGPKQSLCSSIQQLDDYTIECITVPYVRPFQFYPFIRVGGPSGQETAAPQRANMIYGPPIVTRITKRPSDPFPDRFRTSGGDVIQLWGYNYGSFCVSMPILCSPVQLAFVDESDTHIQCTSQLFVNETLIECLQSPGTGASLRVKVSIDGVGDIVPGITFSYSRPSLLSVSGPTTASRPGDVITITGRDFGNDRPKVSVWLHPVAKSGDICVSSRYCLPLLESDSIIRCTINNEPSNLLEDCGYRVQVTVNGQNSTETNVIYRNRVPNRPPTAQAIIETTDENQQKLIQLVGTDIDGDILNYKITQVPQNGRLFIFAFEQPDSRGNLIQSSNYQQVIISSEGKVVYVPNDYFHGFDTFSYSAIEGGSGLLQSSSVHVNITVQSVNQAPYVDNIATTVSVAESSVVNITLAAKDHDSSELFRYKIVELPGSGILKTSTGQVIGNVPYEFSDSQAMIQVIFEPVPFESGSLYAQFKWNCHDLANATLATDAIVIVNVIPVNDAPVSYDFSVQVDENVGNNVGYAISLQGNDPDTNDRLTFFIDELPRYGLLYQVAADRDVQSELIGGRGIAVRNRNTVLYVPNVFYNGQDGFKFLAEDQNRVQSVVSRVNITVNSINQPPTSSLQVYTAVVNETDFWNPVEIRLADVDELKFLDVLFPDKPQRALWSLDGGATTMTFPAGIQIPITSESVDGTTRLTLYVKQDGRGGGVPYASLEFQITDSLNATLNNVRVIVNVECSVLTFNNIWSPSGRACEACPQGGICSRTGDHLPVNQVGFYPASSNGSLFLPCSPPQACPAGEITRFISNGAQAFTATFSCRDGYTGDRCGQCSSGYFRQGQSCEICSQNVSLTGMIFIALGALTVLLVLINFLRKLDLGFINVLINYLQLLAIFKTFELGWSKEVERLFHIFSFFNLNIEVASPECYVQDSSQAFETKWTIMMALPIIFLGFCVVIIVVYHIFRYIQPMIAPFLPAELRYSLKHKKKKEETADFTPDILQTAAIEKSVEPFEGPLPNFSSSIVSIYVLFLKIIYLIVARKSLEIFDCTLQDDGQFYFDPEPSRVCYEPWWQSLMPWSVLGIIFYVLGIPALIYVLFNERRRLLQVNERTPLQNFILMVTYKKKKEYNDNVLYWDVVILVRKFLVVASGLFFTNQQAFQALLLILILQAAILIHNQMKPYVIPTLNYLEVICLFSATVIMTCGMLFYVSSIKSEVQGAALTLAVLLVVSLSLATVLLAMLRHFAYMKKAENKQP